MLPGVDGIAAETVTWIGVLVADDGEEQGAFEVITTVTLSPLFREELVNTGLFVPTFVPFIFHW